MSSNEITRTTAGYFYVKVSHSHEGRFFHSNNERAFVISQLQDLLYMRSVLEGPSPYRRLASHIDLLAYSLNNRGIELVIFAISKESAQILAEIMTARLTQYQDEHPSSPRLMIAFPIILVRPLRGPHHALARTVGLHKKHKDWEYDRYSSIGFYLHDRRGDWMRIWRLSRLYDNKSATYRELFNKAQVKTATKAAHSQLVAP